jgi:hypothetical protein
LHGALQRARIAVAGEEDDRDRRILLNCARGLNAVDATAQVHVHQHELRVHGMRHRDCFRALAGDSAHVIAEAGQRLFQVACNDSLILDQQDRDRRGGRIGT